MEGNDRQALGSAEMAMKGLTVGTPDYLRAEDIAMTARNAVADKKKHGQ